jgi:uncharacterized membrane protein
VDWFILSLIGAAALSVTGIIDKFILGRFVKDTLAYLVVLVLMQQMLVVFIPAHLGWGFVYPQTFYAIITGAFQVILWAAYLIALKQEETSRVAALVYVFPVFVFLGAFLFLGETLGIKDYLGGGLLVASALMISYRPGEQDSYVLSPALKYMSVFWIFTATYALASKYLLSFMTEWHLILWSSIGSLLTVLPLLGRERIRKETAAYFQSGAFLIVALFADELFDLLGRGAFIFAYGKGSVALVSSVAAMQPFITLIYVLLLGLFVPGVLAEELDKKTMALKMIAVLLIVIGVYLVS